MKPAAEALDQILDSVIPTTKTEYLPLLQAQNKILAASQFSSLDVPPADNSAMDGFAFNTADLEAGNPTWFGVSQRIAAGSTPSSLAAKTAARIFTGAEIPSGANAVVMQEDCQIDGDRVLIPGEIEAGNNIRPQGQDIAKGSEILSKGDRLTPQALGLLASIGIAEVEVFSPLRIAILSTGDELAEPGEQLKPGQIYNSNRYLLSGLINQLSMQVVDLGRVADTPEATIQALSRATLEADVIISTGGVSVGEEDHIKAAIEKLGQLSLWKLAIKPGKPLAFGRVGETPFIGLPGNPLSSFITFLFFARPYLQQMQGQQPLLPKGTMQPSSFQRKARIRQEYVMVRVDDYGNIQAYQNQSSGVLSSTTWSNAIAIVPANTDIQVGDTVEVIRYNQLF